MSETAFSPPMRTPLTPGNDPRPQSSVVPARFVCAAAHSSPLSTRNAPSRNFFKWANYKGASCCQRALQASHACCLYHSHSTSPQPHRTTHAAGLPAAAAAATACLQPPMLPLLLLLPA